MAYDFIKKIYLKVIPVNDEHEYAEISIIENKDSELANISYACNLNPFQWRHNERDGVPNHQRLECLLSWPKLSFLTFLSKTLKIKIKI